MRAVYPLVILSCFFLFFRVCWFAYDYAFDKSENSSKQCLCTCVDSKTDFAHGLQTTVVYSGALPANNSCSCMDFFVPKVQNFFNYLDLKELCNVCDCDFEKSSSSDISLTYQELCDVIIVTVVCVTCIVLLQKWLQVLNGEMSRHHVEERRERRLVRVLRGMRDYLNQHPDAEKEYGRYPETLRVHITDKRGSHDYQTFTSEH